MTNRPKVLVVDLNNVWNKYLFGRRGDFSRAIGSILALYRDIYRTKEFAKVYVVIDGKPSERYNEFKEYKSNRKHNPDRYIPMKTITSVLSQYFTVVGGKHVEGDDVVAFLARRLQKKYDTYIQSNDKDFLQLMQYGIQIVTEFRIGKIHKVLSKEDALNKFKDREGTPLSSIEQILPYRVFKGDSSDNIPSACKGMYDSNIRRVLSYWVYENTFNEDVLLTIIGKMRKFGSVKDLKIVEKLVQNKERILQNYKLMDLCHIPDSFKQNIQKIWYKLDVNALQEYIDNEGLYKW